jgi:hypothetical protein
MADIGWTRKVRRNITNLRTPACNGRPIVGLLEERRGRSTNGS